jgi:Ca2+-transporting ATPase
MALGVEPPEPGIMNRKPRPKNEGIFARGLGWTVLARGSYIACISISAFLIGYLVSRANGVDGLPLARSMAFTTLVLAQLFYVFECRSEHYSPFELGFFTNKFLVGSVCCSVCMQLCAIYVPFMKNIFQTVSLDWWHWVIIIMLSGIKFIWRLVMYTWQKLFMPEAGYAKINS